MFETIDAFIGPGELLTKRSIVCLDAHSDAALALNLDLNRSQVIQLDTLLRVATVDIHCRDGTTDHL